ncbi:MAG: tyrosine phosphatase family protein [Xanthobacteraceae bacterium]
MIHVCSLSRLQKIVEDTGARHVVSLIGDEARLQRPDCIAPENHLWLRFHDISAPLDGYVMPGEQHVAELLDFVREWDRQAPLVVHCYMGISRSTATAFTTVCALNPRRDEDSIAQALRRASPTATPNRRIVSIADRLLGRDGRMIAAIETIGRGALAAEATPFRLDLE